jgi:hypothetical protein
MVLYPDAGAVADDIAHPAMVPRDVERAPRLD